MSNLNDIETYYQAVFGFKPYATQGPYRDGTKVLTYSQFSAQDADASVVQLRYIERPAGQQTQKGYSTAWFQQYLVTAVAELMVGKHNNESCWPVWGDNHYALFTTLTTNKVIANLNAAVAAGTIPRALAQWHGFLGQENSKPGFGHTAMYILEPSGWQIEVNSPWHNPPRDMDIDVGDFSGYHRC